MISNPILPGFNPDPSILKAKGYYYIAVSSFEWFPGIPIYRSQDLKNWELMTHAITRKEQADLTGLGSAMGVWAPSLSYNPQTDRFYIAYSIVRGCDNNNFDVDNYYVESSCIEEGWSDAIYINSSGFDPSLFHDTDGKTYVVNLEWDFRQGYEHPGAIVLQPFNLETQKLEGLPCRISKGATNRGCMEGPNLYKKDDFYYLILAEGGTGYGHCVTVSRSKHIEGPYEGCPHNPIITSQPNDFNERGVGDSSKAWRYYEGSILQKSGHGSIVETDNGEVYCAHLCSRPYAPELRSVLGREAALQKCEWTEDGWIRLKGENNLAQITVEEQEGHQTEDTNCYKISMKNRWYTLRDKKDEAWCQMQSDGSILLKGRETLFSRYNQSLVSQKVTDFEVSLSTKLTFTPENFLQMAGISNYYNASAFYYFRVYYSESLGGIALGVMKSEGGVKFEYREHRVLLDAYQGYMYLKSEIKARELTYAYSLDGCNWCDMGLVLDSTLLSDECAHGFTGSMMALTAQDLYTKSKWARFEEISIK